MKGFPMAEKQDDFEIEGGRRGFANMSSDRQRQIASKGGQSVPSDKRSFSQDPKLASEAGKKGGKSVPAHLRSFATNPGLAVAAGRKGGQVSGSHRAQVREVSVPEKVEESAT